ncbi:MAG: trehalose-phosphatase [Nitrospiria bacterium]
MRYLFSLSGKRFLDSPPLTETLFAFDFDGTLAPIISSPDKASIPQKTEELLRRLSAMAATAIISGRSIEDLREKLQWFPGRLIGNHGIEGLPSQALSARKAKKICKEWKTMISEKERIPLTLPGVTLEDKVYSLTFHYRHSRNKKKTLSTLLEVIRKLVPSPRIVPGKLVLNLIPPGAPHKGDALRELMLQLNVKYALYVGDDDTDKDVYSLSDPRITSVHVGWKRNSQAQFYVKRQFEVNQILKMILTGSDQEKEIEKE